MRSLILPIGLLTVVGVSVSVACSSSTPAGGTIVTVTWPAGTVPDSCSDGDAILVSTDECSCGGSSYAICSGGTYSECDCSLPTGDTLVTGGSDGGGTDAAGGDGGGTDAAGGDSGGDAGSTGDTGTDAGGGTDSGGTDAGSATDAAHD
jgi:hypothetical protein